MQMHEMRDRATRLTDTQLAWAVETTRRLIAYDEQAGRSARADDVALLAALEDEQTMRRIEAQVLTESPALV
jgi:hypothetical protein